MKMERSDCKEGGPQLTVESRSALMIDGVQSVMTILEYKRQQ